jgi:hypothetical protein
MLWLFCLGHWHSLLRSSKDGAHKASPFIAFCLTFITCVWTSIRDGSPGRRRLSSVHPRKPDFTFWVFMMHRSRESSRINQWWRKSGTFLHFCGAKDGTNVQLVRTISVFIVTYSAGRRVGVWRIVSQSKVLSFATGHYPGISKPEREFKRIGLRHSSPTRDSMLHIDHVDLMWDSVLFVHCLNIIQKILYSHSWDTLGSDIPVLTLQQPSSKGK